MNIFNNLFGKNYDDEIQIITEKFQKKEFESTIKLGENIINKLKGNEKEKVEKILALSYFNIKKPNKALSYFENIASSSANSDDWFNVTSSAILAGEIDKGMNAFSKAIEIYNKNPKPNSIPIGMMSFYVMQAFKDTKEYDLAFVQLMKLKDVYCQLKITDDHFLHMRGLPFLGQVLDVSKTIIINQNIKDSQEWLIEFASGLDEDGKSLVEKLADEIKQVGNN